MFAVPLVAVFLRLHDKMCIFLKVIMPVITNDLLLSNSLLKNEDGFSKARSYCSFTITDVVLRCVFYHHHSKRDIILMHPQYTCSSLQKAQQKLNFQSVSKATRTVQDYSISSSLYADVHWYWLLHPKLPMRPAHQRKRFQVKL